MAHLVSDSFDQYSALADLTSGPTPQWDAQGGGAGAAISANGRFTGSRAFLFPGATTIVSLQRTWGSNDTPVVFRFAMLYTPALSGTNALATFAFFDGAANSAQCGVMLRSDGAICLTSNGVVSSPTVLATYTGAFTSNTWTTFEVELTISNTVGRLRILKNGNTSTGAPDYDSGATFNTRNGTTNAWVNCIKIATCFGPSSNQLFLDDFLLFNETGATPNAWGLGDIRAVTLQPTANSSVQFTGNHATTTGNTNQAGNTTFSYALADVWFSGFLSGLPITGMPNGLLTSIVISLNAGVTGHINAALYDSSGAGNTPGVLIASGTQVTNPSAGLVTITFSSPPTINALNSYWIAVQADVAIVLVANSVTAARFLANSYGSGFPLSAAGNATTGATDQFWWQMNISTPNWALESEAQEDGDTSYVFDSTVGQVDQYTIAALATTPASIAFVKSFCFARKSDAGARGGQVEINSAGTTADSTATLLSTSYGYLWAVYPTDPHTAAAWGAAAVNALLVGPKVSS
jgi:hypothetical protein